MPQITVYLDKETEEKMRTHLKGRNISQSQWVASVIREKLRSEGPGRSEWPEQILALAGAWKDFPSLEEIRGESSSEPGPK